MRLAALLMVATACLVATPTAAPAAAPAAHSAVDRAKVRSVRAVIIFNKNPDNPWNSRVIWKAFRGKRLIDRADWRAGSGFGGKGTRDSCERGVGWLPNGHYGFVQYDNYWGQYIKGRAFYLGDTHCNDGTPRTELFIHTETGDGNRQCANARGDQVCRWEWPAYNDYRSGGCIKMSPKDMLQLTRRYHEFFRAGERYPDRVHVRVRR